MKTQTFYMRLKRRVLMQALKIWMPKPRMVVILGCMRSGSTLLSHILASNPGLCGVGETWTDYKDPDAPYRVALFLHEKEKRLPRRNQALFDKVLHDRLLRDLRQLPAGRSLVLLLLREPAGNVRSLAKMPDLTFSSAPKGQAALEAAAETYASRYRSLLEIIETRPTDMPLRLVSYERLVADPEGELTALSDFLQLREPLRQEYRQMRTTGQWGLGDGSDNIRAGRIVAPQTTKEDNADMPPARMAELRRLHAELSQRAEKI